MPRNMLSRNGEVRKGQDAEFNNISKLYISLFGFVEIISLRPWNPEEGSIMCVSELAIDVFIISGL